MNDTQLSAWLQAEGFATSPIDIECTIHNATTPLMHAARLGNLEVVQALLARGANSTKLNADGNSALWFACYADSTACAQALIDAGTPFDTQNVNGATALIYCASAGKTPLVQLLLAAGADERLATLDDFTALELAANPECLRLLKAARKARHD